MEEFADVIERLEAQAGAPSFNREYNADAAAIARAVELAGARIAHAVEQQTKELARLLDNLR